MSKFGKFIDNTVDFCKKHAVMGMIGASALFAPTQKADAQTADDGRLWSISVGTAITPNTGPEGKTETNFDFHGMTPGFGKPGTFVGEHNWFTGGFRLTGKSWGGAYDVEGWNYRSRGAWQTKFSTAYLGWTLGKEFKFGKASSLLVGVDNTANMFVGGESNWLNFADYTLGAKARLNLLAGFGSTSGFGLSVEVNQALFRATNKSIFNQVWREDEPGQPLRATNDQVNPQQLIKLAATLKF